MFKTNPRNAGYVCEIRARRNGEAVRDKEVEESDEQRFERLLKEKAEERGTGRMMALETKADQTKIEIAEADCLRRDSSQKRDIGGLHPMCNKSG